MLGVTINPCFLSVLSLVKRAIPRKMRVKIPWMPDWAAVVCCWKYSVLGSTRARVKNEHFSLLWG